MLEWVKEMVANKASLRSGKADSFNDRVFLKYVTEGAARARDWMPIAPAAARLL